MLVSEKILLGGTDFFPMREKAFPHLKGALVKSSMSYHVLVSKKNTFQGGGISSIWAGFGDGEELYCMWHAYVVSTCFASASGLLLS